jgi:hypothetical protein
LESLLSALGFVLTFVAGKLAGDQNDTKLSAVLKVQNVIIEYLFPSAIREKWSYGSS